MFQCVLTVPLLEIVIRECKQRKMIVPLLGAVYSNITYFGEFKLSPEMRMSLEGNKKIKDDRFILTILFLGSPEIDVTSDGNNVIKAAFSRLKKADLGVFIDACYKYLYPDSNEDVDNKGKIYSILTYCLEHEYISEAQILFKLIRKLSAFKADVEDGNIETSRSFYKSVIVHNLYSSEPGLVSLDHNIVLSASRVVTTAERVVVIARAILSAGLDDKRALLVKSKPIMVTMFSEENADWSFLLNKLIDSGLPKESLDLLRVVFQNSEGSFKGEDYLEVGRRLVSNLSEAGEVLGMIFNEPFIFDLKHRVSLVIDIIKDRAGGFDLVNAIVSGFVEASFFKGDSSFYLFLDYILKNELYEDFLRLLKIPKVRDLMGDVLDHCSHDYLARFVGHLLEGGCDSWINVLYRLAREHRLKRIQELIVDKVISLSCQGSQKSGTIEPFETNLFKGLELDFASQRQRLFYARCSLSYFFASENTYRALDVLEDIIVNHRYERKKLEVFRLLYNFKIKNSAIEDLIEVGADAVAHLRGMKLSKKNKSFLVYRETIFSLLDRLRDLDWNNVNEGHLKDLFSILNHLSSNIEFYVGLPSLEDFINKSIRQYCGKNFNGYDIECLQTLGFLAGLEEFNAVREEFAGFYFRMNLDQNHRLFQIVSFFFRYSKGFVGSDMCGLCWSKLFQSLFIRGYTELGEKTYSVSNVSEKYLVSFPRGVAGMIKEWFKSLSDPVFEQDHDLLRQSCEGSLEIFKSVNFGEEHYFIESFFNFFVNDYGEMENHNFYLRSELKKREPISMGKYVYFCANLNMGLDVLSRITRHGLCDDGLKGRLGVAFVDGLMSLCSMEKEAHNGRPLVKKVFLDFINNMVDSEWWKSLLMSNSDDVDNIAAVLDILIEMGSFPRSMIVHDFFCETYAKLYLSVFNKGVFEDLDIAPFLEKMKESLNFK